MRSAWVFLAGMVLGILLIIGWVQLARAFGQSMTGPMGPVMAQMMGPQSMADMMAQMMHDPKFMGAMESVCAQAMKDPTVLRSMQQAMDNPEMRQLMEQILNSMQRP